LDSRLHDDLWGKGVPIILTSGTLSASGMHGQAASETCGQPGDFTRAKQTLGLNHLDERKLFTTTMPSPFDFKNNKLLYISENVPFPDNKDKRYIQAVADEVERLVMASHGHAAVLFTSYNAMGQVHAILKNRNLPFPLFRLERGGVHAIERFKKSGNGILFASGSMWEGIDCPGDILSLLVIVKLPFAQPDAISEYEQTRYTNFGAFFDGVLMPDMQIKTKQGYGRGFRTENDTCVVAICDCRALADYYESLIAALPKSPVTTEIVQVVEFYKTHKSPDFFINIEYSAFFSNNEKAAEGGI
jgi:ATP-dependent DNA helicase DinG